MYALRADGSETEGTHGNIQVKIALACKRRTQTISYGRRIRRRLQADINIVDVCAACECFQAKGAYVCRRLQVKCGCMRCVCGWFETE